MEMYDILLAKALGGSNGGGGGGAEIESGEWATDEDVQKAFISFSKTHDTPPAFFYIKADTDEFVDTNTVLSSQYSGATRIFGSPTIIRSSGVKYLYSIVLGIERMTQSYAQTQTQLCTSGDDVTEPASTNLAYARNWVVENGFYFRAIGSTNYIRSALTYKWIAIWL